MPEELISIAENDLWEFQQKICHYRYRFSLAFQLSGITDTDLGILGSTRINSVIMSAATENGSPIRNIRMVGGACKPESATLPRGSCGQTSSTEARQAASCGWFGRGQPMPKTVLQPASLLGRGLHTGKDHRGSGGGGLKRIFGRGSTFQPEKITCIKSMYWEFISEKLHLSYISVT